MVNGMFKKIILFIGVFSFLTGCVNKENNLDNKKDDLIIEEENIIDTYVDNNMVKVGLYNNKYKVTEYKTTLGNMKDIGVFDVYFTDKQMVDSSNTKTNFLKYAQEYDDISNHKIGFYISFVAQDSMIEEVILDPSKQHKMEPYLYIYLYDDVNQTPGTYYSHLEMDDMKDNTVFSSIKLFLAQEGVKIESPITLSVFTYDGIDDFDDNGRYRGNSYYTFEIQTK